MLAAPWVKVLSVAACLCILMVGAFALDGMTDKHTEMETAAPVAPHAAPEAVPEAAPEEAPALEEVAPEYDIPNMFLCEDADFINAMETGEKSRNYIDNVLETAKLLEGLYVSADKKEEIKL